MSAFVATATAVISACTVSPPSAGIRPQVAAPRIKLPEFPPAGIQLNLLQAHNRERALVGSAPLQWDRQLQAAADAYARYLAATGRFEHATSQALKGQGENLWTGTRGAFAPRRMVADWASGSRYFQHGEFPEVSRTGNWSDVGHYTQIIWPATQRVGCAISSSSDFDYLVCRYAPGGNVIGTRVP